MPLIVAGTVSSDLTQNLALELQGEMISVEPERSADGGFCLRFESDSREVTIV